MLQKPFEAELLRRGQASLAATASSVDGSGDDGYEVWLFGSRARGDWDGWSDTDLLGVANAQAHADQLAKALLDAGLGADVIALSSALWHAMASSCWAHHEARPLAWLRQAHNDLELARLAAEQALKGTLLELGAGAPAHPRSE